MTLETLRILRNVLLRSFVVGLVLIMAMALATMAAWDTWTGLAGGWFHTDETVLVPIVLKFFVDVRFFLLFVVLAPGLGIHWTIKRELAKQSSAQP